MNKCNSSSCSKLSAIIETFFSSVFHNAGWICSYSNGTTPVIAEDRQPAQLSRVPFGFLEVSMALMNGEIKSQTQALALLSTATMWRYQIQPLMSNHCINSTDERYCDLFTQESCLYSGTSKSVLHHLHSCYWMLYNSHPALPLKLVHICTNKKIAWSVLSEVHVNISYFNHFCYRGHSSSCLMCV